VRALSADKTPIRDMSMEASIKPNGNYVVSKSMTWLLACTPNLRGY
jgi:hypothetical protein